MSGGPRGRLARLRALRDECSAANRHEQATVLISACIAEGVDTKSLIIRTLYLLGFKPAHVANVLKHGTGFCPLGNHWWVDGRGRYLVHGEAPPPSADAPSVRAAE